MTSPLLKGYILISAAVKDELEFLKSKLQNVREYPSEILHRVSGTLENRQVLLVATNPGVVNTASALTTVIEKLRPSLIIQTGCAGAFIQSGIKTGDIGIASCEIDIHTGVQHQDNTCEYPLRPLPFPIIARDNITNRFPTNKKFSIKAKDIISANINGYSVYEPFITVSTITASKERERQLYDAFAPCLESMEGSAAAHIASLYNLPFLEIRAASNMVGDRNKNNWDLPMAFNRSNRAVFEFILNTGEIS